MNGPSLRGYGASMGKNARRGGGSGPPSPLQIDPSKLNHLRSLDFNEFLEAPDVSVQLGFIRNLLKNYKFCTTQLDCIEFVVVVFLESSLKHPLKDTSSKLLISIEKIEEVSLLVYSKLHSTIESAEKNDFQQLNSICDAIGSSIDIFPTNIHISTYVSEIYNFLKHVLETYVEKLSCKSSLFPTDRTNLYLYIHNCIRIIIGVLQKLKFEPNKTWFNKVYSSCEYLINHHELPTDTKANCAIVIVTSLNILHGPNTWIKFLENSDVESTSEYLLKVNSDIVKLTVLSAILNIINVNDLCTKLVNNSPALNVISHNLIKLSSVSSLNSVIILGSARSILHITKLLLEVKDKMNLISDIAHIFLDFVWSHLDYYVDSVRHLTMQILSNILKLASSLDENDHKLSSTLVTSIIDSPNTHSINFKALICLGSEYNCSYLLQRNPDLPTRMISNINNFIDSSNVTSAFEVLMTKHYGEVSHKIFYSTWIDPILNKLISFDSSMSDDFSLILSMISGILLKAVKLNPDILKQLVSSTFHKDLFNMTNGKFKCILVCLNVARKYGYLDSKISTNTIWKEVISYDFLNISIKHQSAEIRLLAFSLLIESHKTTEYFDKSELELIKFFLQYNINVKSSNLHQKILSFIKKLFERWQCGYSKYLKSISVIDAQNLSDLSPIHTKCIESNLCENYVQFIQDVSSICLNSIFPGANFFRKNISMVALIACQTLCEKNKLKSNFWKTEHIPLIYDYLNDSYECNKQLSMSLLILCPVKHNLFYRGETWFDAFKDAILKASSVKPTECMSSAYKIELLINKHPPNIWYFYERLGLQEILKESNMVHVVHFNTVKLLLNLLENEKNTAKNSILLAAANGPMYGILYCIRHLLGKLNMRSISKYKCWSEMINNLIKISFDISDVVKLIVNNSSPEGHLPMDFNTGSFHVEKNGVQLESGKSVTAQMVLLCAWRSIKEVSLLLGDISSQAPISTNPLETFSSKDNIEQNGIVSIKCMLDIGDHFITLLSETKHRGAFEQAYVGFSKLCLRLWKCDIDDLHILPKTWIDDLITAISSGKSDNSKLCATRRSAGVPFIIQALVTTELQASSAPNSFHLCINTLLMLTKLHSNDNSHHLETKVHCLNILRTLYRHSPLGEHVNQYVTEGLIISINGFNGATWAERNASTLLFSSLMSRIFGVQRTKNSDQLSIRNKMTGRIFFLRYPNLYDYLSSCLKSATENQQNNTIKPSLYPVLLLLSRLYPSSLEGTDSNLRLVVFIPYLIRCAGNCVLKIRQLAAKAIVPLITQERYFFHIMKLFGLLEKDNLSHNFKHGILLQLIKLLQNFPDTLVLNDSNLKLIIEKLEFFQCILVELSNNRPCFYILDAHFKVILLCLKRFPRLVIIGDFYFQNLKTMLHKYSENSTSYDLAIGIEDVHVKILHIELTLTILMNNSNRADIIFSIIYQNMTNFDEVVQKVLNYILCFYNIENLENVDEKFDITDDEKSLVLRLSSEEISDVLKQFNSSIDFRKKMFLILKNSTNFCSREKCLIILTFLPDSVYDLVKCSKSTTKSKLLESLVSSFESEHEQINYVYLKFVNNYLTENISEKCSIYDIVDNVTVKKLTNVIKDCSSVSQKNEAIDILLKHCFYWKSENANDTQYDIILTQWSTIIKYLRDQNDAVSSKIYKAITKTFDPMKLQKNESNLIIFNENCILELLLEFYTKFMMKISLDHAIAALLILAIGEYDTNKSLLDEDLVFDKNEDSEVQEECEITLKCLRYIEDLIKKENITKPKHEIIFNNSILKKWINTSESSSLKKLFEYIYLGSISSEKYDDFGNNITSFKMKEIFLFFNKS